MLPSRMTGTTMLTIGRRAVLPTNRSDTTGRLVAIASLSAPDSETGSGPDGPARVLTSCCPDASFIEDFGIQDALYRRRMTIQRIDVAAIEARARMRAPAAPR